MRKFLSLFVAALVCASTFATTYTVAGSSGVVFGTSWDPANAANDMTLVEGTTYQFVKTGVELPICAIKFKVCEDHGWTVAYPAQDYELSIPAAGIYDITITFDAGESKAVNATAEKKGDSDIRPTVVLHGTFEGSGWADTQEFTPAEDKQTATLKLNLGKNIYYFGVKENGSWYANGNAYKRSGIKEGTGDMRLMADVAGEYTFTWTYETKSLSVEFPLPAPTDFTLANGYYLVGNFNNWIPSAEYLFAATETEGEYKLERTCGADTLKVVYVESDLMEEWYGENNYGLPESLQTKEATFYFRPESKADWTALDGHLYVEEKEQGEDPITPIVVKDLKLVPGVWTKDNAVLGCWAWGEEAEGAWSVFAGEGDTLTAKINGKADSVIFVRFKAGLEELRWDAENDTVIWNRTPEQEIAECGLFFVNAWDNYSWCEPVKVYEFSQLWKANAETTPVAAGSVYMDNHLLKLESVYPTTINENSYTIDDVAFEAAIQVRTNTYPDAEHLTGEEYVKNGGTGLGTSLILTAKEDARISLYYRRQLGENTLNDGKDLKIFDQAAITTALSSTFDVKQEIQKDGATTDLFVVKTLEIEKGHVYTLTAKGTTLLFYGILAEGDAYVPVHANGYYLLGNFNDWTLSDDYLFVANGDQEGEFKLDVTFAAGDTLKVAYVENDAAQTWYGEENYGVPAESLGEATVYFRPVANPEWTALSKHIYIAPKQPVIGPTLANGYYLIGEPWSIESLSEDVLFEANPGAEGEYMLNTTLAEGQEIKVVEVEDGALKTWFPEGMGNAYMADAAHAGNVTIYFRPDGQGGEGWHAGFFYIDANGSTAIGNTAADAKAVKVLRNGMLLIEKNGKTYNVLGAMVR